jgi:hypothetical protein
MGKLTESFVCTYIQIHYIYIYMCIYIYIYIYIYTHTNYSSYKTQKFKVV